MEKSFWLGCCVTAAYGTAFGSGLGIANPRFGYGRIINPPELARSRAANLVERGEILSSGVFLSDELANFFVDLRGKVHQFF